MSIVDPKNQAMLYDVMLDIIIDNNIILDDHVNIQDFIRQKCVYFHSQRFDFGTKEDINKKIIDLCYNFILANKKKEKKSPNVVQPDNRALSDNIQKAEMIESISKLSKQEIFDMTYQAKKENFETAMKVDKPDEIDFGDKNSDNPIKNLDQIMSQTLADRERELKTITEHFSKNQKEKALEWLSNGKNNEENINMTISEETPKITISEQTDVNLDIMNVAKAKKVTFNLDEESEQLENKNKKEKVEKVELKVNELLEVKLDMIISNQKMILEILKKNDLLNDTEEESHSEVTEFDAI